MQNLLLRNEIDGHLLFRSDIYLFLESFGSSFPYEYSSLIVLWRELKILSSFSCLKKSNSNFIFIGCPIFMSFIKWKF